MNSEGSKIINVTSKGQALTLLRQRNKIKKDFDNVHKSGIKLSYLEKIIGDLK